MIAFQGRRSKFKVTGIIFIILPSHKFVYISRVFGAFRTLVHRRKSDPSLIKAMLFRPYAPRFGRYFLVTRSVMSKKSLTKYGKLDLSLTQQKYKIRAKLSTPNYHPAFLISGFSITNADTGQVLIDGNLENCPITTNITDPWGQEFRHWSNLFDASITLQIHMIHMPIIDHFGL